MNIAVIIVGLQDTPNEAYDTARQFRRALGNRVRIIVVLNKRGREGYATGVNKGIRIALRGGAQILLVANPDIQLLRLSYASIKAAAALYDVWGYRFRQHGIVYHHGSLDHMRLSGTLISNKSKQKDPRIDFISGSLICFRRSVLQKIGLFNERYHMYYEDVEFCQRAYRAGLTIGVVPTVAYEHYESGLNDQKELQLFMSRLRFFWEYASVLQKIRECIRLPRTVFEHRSLIIGEFARRPFIKNFMTLNLSSLSIKLFTFLLFLFLVRKLSPASFGLYNLIWAQVALFMPLADLGTTNYGIFHLKDNATLLRKLFSLRLFLGGIFAVITVLYTAAIFRDPTILLLTSLSVPIMLSNAVSGSFLIHSTIQAKAFLASYYAMGYNLILILSLILYLQISNAITGLFIIEGIVALLYSVVLLRRMQGSVPLSFRLPTRSFVIKTVQRSYIYVLLTFFAGLYFKIDLFILQMYHGSTAVGLYSSGYKFFEALIFIGSSYTIAATPVYRMYLSKRSTKKRARAKLLRDATLLFVGGMLLSCTSAWLAPTVIGPLIGSGFSAGLRVFQIVIFALPFLLVSSVCMNLLYLLKRTHWVVQLFVVQIVVNIVANMTFVPLFSYNASAIITVVSEVLNAAAVLPLALKAYEDLS